MSALVFLDCETLGLDIDDPIWEIAVIRRDPDGVEHRYQELLTDRDGRLLDRPDGLPEPFASDFQRRYHRDQFATHLHPSDFAHTLRGLLHDRPHIVGAVPNFDTERIERQLGVSGWHYHLIDVENLAVGWLRGSGYAAPDLPWDSDALSHMVGVDPGWFDRHTAMGDAMWARAIYDRVMGDLPPGFKLEAVTL